MKRLRVITSHAGHARYLAGAAENPVGTIARQADIPSPYAYSSTHAVWRHATDGAVIIVETRHRRYEVFAVPAGMIESWQENT